MSKDREEILIDCTTKLFGKNEYSSLNGLDFDNMEIMLNGKKSSFHGTIFEGFSEMQIEKSINLIDSLEILDSKAREKWLELLEEEEEEVCGFIDIHHNEYGKEVKELILKKLNLKKQDNMAFIENLEFGSFHICQVDEEESVEIVMDYSLIWEGGSSFTDQILAMHFTDKLKYNLHTHDS